jgi:hypothetical protein
MDAAGPQPKLTTGPLPFTVAGTYNSPSIDLPSRVGGLAFAVRVTNISGAGATVTAKLQHAADDDTVNDAGAAWVDITGASVGPITTNTMLAVAVTVPHLRRVRFNIVRGGTWTTGSIECVLQ